MIGCSRSIRAFPSNPSYHRRGIGSTLTFFSTRPIIELREYELYPEHAATYIQKNAGANDLRMSHLPLRFFSLPDTGGQLMVATHAYYYAGGLAERDEKNAALDANEEWKDFVQSFRPCLRTQSSTLWTEAPLIPEIMKESTSVWGLGTIPDSKVIKGNNCILEIRRYKLKLGYDTVPEFLNLYGSGLPSKLNAPGTDSTTSLVSVMCNEVGRLNEVIEVWRHGNGTSAMEASRQAARNAPAWRQAIASIADQVALEFTTTIHKPLSFSPIK